MSENLSQQISTIQLEPHDFNRVTPLEDKELDQLIIEVHTSLHDEDANAANSLFSNYSTPNAPGRSGTSFTTAKKYLLAWLRAVNSFHCSITLVPISETRVIQIAHMLLPQSASTVEVSYSLVFLCMKH